MTAIQYLNPDGYNDTSVSLATPLPVTSVAGGTAVSASNPLITSPPNAGSPTYIYTVSGYTAYATPTDMVGITGSASKTIRVHNMWMAINSTAAALQVIHFVKRSTANTGGTDGAPTGIALDSANAAPTATLHSYTGAPTPGTSVGDVRLQSIASTVVTTNGGAVSFFAPVNIEQVNPSAVALDQTGVVLRGVAESLFLNYAGAALTTGFTATWGVLWSELPNTF